MGIGILTEKTEAQKTGKMWIMWIKKKNVEKGGRVKYFSQKISTLLSSTETDEQCGYCG